MKVLYILPLKDLYDLMESELLLYDIYTKTLKSHGSVVNLYDRFIANSTIDGKQCIISFYVDYNKLLNVYEDINTIIIGTIAENFGGLTVSRGGNKSSW